MLRRVIATFVVLLAVHGCDDKKNDPPTTSAKSESPAKVAENVEAPAKSDTTKAAPPAVTAPPVAVPPTEVAKPAEPSPTPEMKALDDTLKPILAITDDDARAKAACKALDAINKQVQALGNAPPTGVDAIEWRSAVEGMSGGLNDFEIECAEGTPARTRAISEVADAKGLYELLAKSPR